MEHTTHSFHAQKVQKYTVEMFQGETLKITTATLLSDGHLMWSRFHLFSQ